MSETGKRVAVVGAGMGGLTSALLLAAHGFEVTVYEAGERAGGKIGVASHDGVQFDTGPSVLTMPEVLDAVLGEAGTSLIEELELNQHFPEFRYHYPDGTALEVYPDLQKTLDGVRETLGARDASDFEDFMDYARRIWEAAAPNFIFSQAPSIGSMMKLGFRSLSSVRNIDPMSTMWSAIQKRVDSPYLQHLLARYATYNGSDVRQAPATLNCISWVEMGMGGWGIQGGMYAVAEVFERIARRQGAEFHFNSPVRRLHRDGEIWCVETDVERRVFDAVVVNVDVSHLIDGLLPGDDRGAVQTGDTASMSGWNAVIRARRREHPERTPHAVLFPPDYMEEFADIFDRDRPPETPTVYLCAQEKAHGREGWADAEPLFVMANAPPEPAGGARRDPEVWEQLRASVMNRLHQAELIDRDDEIVWERTPADLAERFPGSRGSIYGAASNSKFAAFNRPSNRVDKLPGLFLAGGSAHPGGGVPMCVQSGRLAAQAVAEDA